jgi:hypothetical protein
MIAGIPRSGTTFLQRLMGQDRRFKVTLTWESYLATSPVEKKNFDSNPYINKTAEYLNLIAKTSPSLFVIHPMKPKWPEECWMLIERQFIRILSSGFWEVEEYLRWLYERSDDDLTADYQYYKKQLQILQYHWDRPKWLLKSPAHGPFLIPIKNVLPDIKFIFCHREPTKMVPSLCSLLAVRKTAYYKKIDLQSLGKKGIDLLSRAFERSEKARSYLEKDQVIHISFRKMMENPIGTIEELYRQLDLELSEEAKNRMKGFIESQKTGKHTHHRYSSEDFHLSVEKINKHLSGYIDRYHEYF